MRFELGKRYARPDVKEIAGLGRASKGGNFDTGIVEYDGEYLIFANIGASGRTGHEYPNHWHGDDRLWWYHKNRSRLEWPSVARLLEPRRIIHVFCRSNNSDPFTYSGLASPLRVVDSSPVQVLWQLNDSSPGDIIVQEPEEETLPAYMEGGTDKVLVNAYERSRNARSACLAHHGYNCVVCGFSFAEFYGDLGVGFIHVHHLIPLAELRKEYAVDPVKDLRPVCANCHAMLHRERPTLTIEQLKNYIEAAQ